MIAAAVLLSGALPVSRGGKKQEECQWPPAPK
jgi:hypothetical protein